MRREYGKVKAGKKKMVERYANFQWVAKYNKPTNQRCRKKIKKKDAK